MSSLQYVLSRVEGSQRLASGRQRRDPLEYQLSIFGEPSPTASWGWRFGGHHVSLSYAILDGTRVSVTPSFFGAEPSDSPLAGGTTLRPLGFLEDLGRDLARSLDQDQLVTAKLSHGAPHDMIVGNQPLVDGLGPPHPRGLFRTAPDDLVEYLVKEHSRTNDALGESLNALRFTFAPKGIPASSLLADQREILDALMKQYVERLPDDLAQAELDKLAAPDSNLHFAWAGPFERGQAHYYRVQGSQVLLEYDNLHGNHIHALWRDPVGEFGDNPLLRHRAVAHSA